MSVSDVLSWTCNIFTHLDIGSERSGGLATGSTAEWTTLYLDSQRRRGDGRLVDCLDVSAHAAQSRAGP